MHRMYRFTSIVFAVGARGGPVEPPVSIQLRLLVLLSCGARQCAAGNCCTLMDCIKLTVLSPSCSWMKRCASTC